MGQTLNKRGFGLGEIVLSLGLLAVALLALLGVFIAGLPHLQTNEALTAAASLGRNLHEEIRAQASIPEAPASFDGALPDPKVNEFPPAPYPSIRLGRRKVVFRVDVLPSTADDVAEIVVTASTGDDKVVQRGLYYVP